MRQKEDNPLVSTYLELRDAISEFREANIDRTSIKKGDANGENGETGVQFFLDKMNGMRKWGKYIRR